MASINRRGSFTAVDPSQYRDSSEQMPTLLFRAGALAQAYKFSSGYRRCRWFIAGTLGSRAEALCYAIFPVPESFRPEIPGDYWVEFVVIDVDRYKRIRCGQIMCVWIYQIFGRTAYTWGLIMTSVMHYLPLRYRRFSISPQVIQPQSFTKILLIL